MKDKSFAGVGGDLCGKIGWFKKIIKGGWRGSKKCPNPKSQ
jgi:hypothetical protein